MRSTLQAATFPSVFVCYCGYGDGFVPGLLGGVVFRIRSKLGVF